MEYAIRFLVISIGAVGMLNGMDVFHGGRFKPSYAAHSYYYYHAVTALAEQDKKRVELYCNLDSKLIPEIERDLTQELKHNKWALNAITEIKLRNNARL